jgi:peptidase YpeB-like protein
MMRTELIAASLVIPAVVTIIVNLTGTDVLEDVKEMAAVANAKVTLDQAIAAATSTIYPGSTLLEAEVDTKNGIPSYVIDVERNGKHTVLVNIRTGEVKTTALEPDDDDNRDNR